jgi:molybdate transport system substrate-binding protein
VTRSRFSALALLLSLALALPALASAADSPPVTTLNVFAAASLREAFAAVGKQFESENNVTVRFNFAGADMLASQIVQGAPADVFASANEAWAKFLAEKGLLGSAPQIFARNRLTIVVPKSNPAAIRDARDLARPGVRIVLEAPTVPIGKYSRDAFKAMSADPAYGADFAAKVESNVVSNEIDVKAVATKISAGEGDAGIVYVTDVAPIAAGVSTVALPPEYTPTAFYPLAVIKGTPSPALAAKFIAYVLSPAGQAILRQHGFLAPAPLVEPVAPAPIR